MQQSRVLGYHPMVATRDGGRPVPRTGRLATGVETWPDPNLDDVELGTELAIGLVEYVTALEPARLESS